MVFGSLKREITPGQRGLSTGRRWLGSWLLIALIAVLVLGGSRPAWAVAPTQQPAETVTIHLGTATGELRFEPDHLTFTAGQRYTLVLDNPSPEKHYFTAKDFADALWTQNVKASDVEIKGAIHELELKPGAVANWTFIPQKPGTYELHCSIMGHAEAGMVGQIVVQAPA